MKKTILFALLGCITISFLANSDRSSSANFIFSAIEEVPVLPASPFSYQVDLPDHVLGLSPDPGSGYGSNEPDLTIVDNIDDDVATLGRVLFYDKKLSALEDLACASCHLPSQSFADNKAFSVGVETPTSRNSMHLNDLGWSKNKGFFWDFRAEGFHEAIQLPLTDANEIGADLDDISIKLENTDYYPALFQAAYGSDKPTAPGIIEALVQFIGSMNTLNSKFDKGAANDFINFNAGEMRGMALFGQDCGSCHADGNGIPGLGFAMPDLTSTIMTSPNILNNGLDAESEDIGVGIWLEGMEGLFKSPTLRNIELTGPYMHDGRLETLDDVIDFYSEDPVTNEWSGFIPEGGFDYSDQEKADLKAFLLTLTDHTVAQNPKWSNPFSIISSTESLEMDVKVMPNPMDLYSVITVDNGSNSRIDITISDASGKILQSDYFTGNSYRIEKADFAAGLYFVNLREDNKLATYKLIVQ